MTNCKGILALLAGMTALAWPFRWRNGPPLTSSRAPEGPVLAPDGTSTP